MYPTVEEDLVPNSTKKRKMLSTGTSTSTSPCTTREGTFQTAGCSSTLPILQFIAVTIAIAIQPASIYVEGFSSNVRTKSPSTGLHRRPLIPTQDVSSFNHRSDWNKNKNSKELQVLYQNISQVWLKNSFCDVFDFETTKENGETVKDITYLANLQIKQLMEHNRSNNRSSADKDSAFRAERILIRLEELNRADTITYNLVINAFSKSTLPDSTLRAEKILNRMEILYQKQMDAVKQYSQCVGNASELQLENQDLLEECGIFDARYDEKIVPSITVKPNVRTYSTVIDAYSRKASDNTDRAEAAQALLEHLRTLYESTGDEELKPNVISYNSVINAWAKTGTVYGVETAMKLLITMENDGIADVISYNAVIHAWARCGSKHSGEKAESILLRMKDRVVMADRMDEDFKEDRDGQSNEKMHVVQFDRMFSSLGSVKPNIRTYSSVIDAWSRSSCPTAARRAQAILNEMEWAFEETGDRSIQPNTVTYSTVINAYARSRDMENKASAALQVLKRMQQVYKSRKNDQAMPSVVTYNSVLNACATTYGVRSRDHNSYPVNEEKNINHGAMGAVASLDDELDTDKSASQSLALGIVKVLYKEMTSPESDIEPDHFTYGTVLKACANLMSPGDADAIPFIREVFQQCCDDGQVSFGVCFQLRQAAPVDLYRDLIPQFAIDMSNGHFVIDRMPTGWSSHLKERRNGHSKR